MLGKAKTGVKLQTKNNKWYRYILQVQVLAFAAMHLILGIYFAFVSSKYANHPGFWATVEDHRKMDQIFAIICFVLVFVWLGQFLIVRKDKKVSLLYYIGMVVSVVVPFVYAEMSNAYILDAMKDLLVADADLVVNGVGNTNELTFWTGFNYGMWKNTNELNAESQLIVDYLSKIGVESGVEMELADFNLAGLLAQFRAEKYGWNNFDLYKIINAAVSAVLVACTIIFVPMKSILPEKLVKLFKKK